jgi:hypothetical protein
VSDLAAVASISFTPASCTAFSSDASHALETTATGGTGLRYDTSSDQFVYNWKSPSPGCYTLLVTLTGGTVLKANFHLT